ncbi:MAG: hypothetical protein GXN94_01920 [Aquificae bacterium]|nr:hypothetical protein [Aquificota bacterium]
MKKLMATLLFFSFAVYGTESGGETAKLFKKYGCDGCHHDYGLVAGPSYYAVKKRYMEKFGDEKTVKEYLYKTIKNGSSGKWFNFIDIKMPPHDKIPDQDLKAMVDYILSLEPPKEENKGVKKEENRH